MNIVLHSDDINILEYWQKYIAYDEIVEEFENLFSIKKSLVILNYTSFTQEIDASIKRLTKDGNFVLVLHSVPNIMIAKKLLKADARGYGNVYMKKHFLISAIETIKDNMVWLYPEFTTELIMGLKSNTNDNKDEILKILTPREQEVSLLVRDGLSYKQIAFELSIGVRTAKSHIQNSYTKLGIKDRLALALLLK